MPLLHVDDLIEPSLLDLERNVIRLVAGGIGVGPFRVKEHEAKMVAHIFHEAQRLLVLVFSFCREARDHVLAQPAIRDDPADAIDQCDVFFAVVSTVHFLQDAGTSGLNGKVNVVADVPVPSDGMKNGIAHVLGVAR